MRVTKHRSSVWMAAVVVIACAGLLRAVAGAQQPQTAESKPVFLVATPALADPFFQRSVILILPSRQGPLVVGLIINRPTAVPIKKLFPELSTLKNQTQTAYFGGPVEIDKASLLIRASQPPDNATRLFDNVYVNADPGSLAKLVRDSGAAKHLRLFLGRAQWTRDQLHAEILEGAWYVMPAEAEQIFSADPGRIWGSLVQRAGVREIGTSRRRQPKIFSPPGWALPHWQL